MELELVVVLMAACRGQWDNVEGEDGGDSTGGDSEVGRRDWDRGGAGYTGDEEGEEDEEDEERE